MTAIGKVSLRGIVHDDFQYVFQVASGTGEATISDAGVKAVSLDTSAANTVKLATDGEKILGLLAVYEDRSDIEGIVVGTIYLHGGYKFLVNPDATSSPDEIPALGDFIVGAVDDDGNAGYVRKATSAEAEAGADNWQVVEVAGDDSYVIAIRV